MVKVSLNTLWKIAVILLLGGILYLTYKIEVNTRSYRYYVPTPVGCGAYNAQSTSTLPNLCVQPLQSQQAK